MQSDIEEDDEDEQQLLDNLKKEIDMKIATIQQKHVCSDGTRNAKIGVDYATEDDQEILEVRPEASLFCTNCHYVAVWIKTRGSKDLAITTDFNRTIIPCPIIIYEIEKQLF